MTRHAPLIISLLCVGVIWYMDYRGRQPLDGPKAKLLGGSVDREHVFRLVLWGAGFVAAVVAAANVLGVA